MDSVIMTTPTNTMRLRSRLRSAANTLCTRNSKRSASNSFGYKTHNARFNIVAAAAAAKNSHSHSHIAKSNINNNVNNQHYPQQQHEQHEQHQQQQLRNSVNGFVHLSKITREVYNAWCGRLGDVTRIPSDSVQALFNDMQLYPSKNQVLEMLQCARQCGKRNNSQFLTFGEFCVFAGELRRGGGLRGNKSSSQPQPQHNNQNHHNNHLNNQTIQNVVNSSNSNSNECEVFLGGSCNPTTWRADIAIPTLKKLGITYYNPQVSQWSPDLMAAEHDAKESATVLLFVVDSQTRCVAGMLEVAHLIAKQRCLVIVAHPFTLGQSIMGEKISSQEYIDLSEGQSTLLTLVKNQGVVVHSNLTSALQSTVYILRGGPVDHQQQQQLHLAERKLTDKLMKLREIYDSIDTDRRGELSLSEVSHAYYQLTGTNLRISDLRAIMDMSSQSQSQSQSNKNKNKKSNNDLENVRISFEQFCGIVAEFTTGAESTSGVPLQGGGGCSSTTTTTTTTFEGANRFSNPIYWKLAMLRTQQLLRNYVVRPIVHILDWLQHSTTPTTNNNNKCEETIISNGNSSNYDIYLGGSCVQRTNWRQNIAIPLLKRYGVTYYNPSIHEHEQQSQINVNVSDLNDNRDNSTNTNTNSASNNSNHLLYDLNVMNDSKIVVFVITNETRSITSMILAAYYIALKKNVVLCVQPLDLDECECIIGTDNDNDMLTKQAIKDYNRARSYLTDLAKHENIPTFQSVEQSLECALQLLQIKT